MVSRLALRAPALRAGLIKDKVGVNSGARRTELCLRKLDSKLISIPNVIEDLQGKNSIVYVSAL